MVILVELPKHRFRQALGCGTILGQDADIPHGQIVTAARTCSCSCLGCVGTARIGVIAGRDGLVRDTCPGRSHSGCGCLVRRPLQGSGSSKQLDHGGNVQRTTLVVGIVGGRFRRVVVAPLDQGRRLQGGKQAHSSTLTLVLLPERCTK